MLQDGQFQEGFRVGGREITTSRIGRYWNELMLRLLHGAVGICT